jgi:hypothetical protein
MSGGGGHIIIQHAQAALTDPLVHGQLSTEMQARIDPILAKDPGVWTDIDKIIVGHAFNWALCNVL